MLSVFAKSHKVCGEVFFLVGGQDLTHMHQELTMHFIICHILTIQNTVQLKAFIKL